MNKQGDFKTVESREEVICVGSVAIAKDCRAVGDTLGRMDNQTKIAEDGGRRLSGFLPVQSVYADFYVRDEYWPDFDPQLFEHALAWFKNQDQILGG